LASQELDHWIDLGRNNQHLSATVEERFNPSSGDAAAPDYYAFPAG
jgi:hypothetical protein